MAQIADLKISYRLFMQAYRYRRIDWRPAARLAKHLSDCRVTIVTTAGFHLPDQPPFDPQVRGGDCSYRVVPASSDVRTLRIAHKSDAFDHAGIEADANLALPLDRLHELQKSGVIGSVAPLHFSFMGSITAPARLIEHTGPEVVDRLQDEDADVVLLTPV